MATKLASRSRPKKEPGPALTPEESTLVIRLGVFVAMRWIRDFARQQKGRAMKDKLAEELISAYKREGGAVKKREDTHRMAEANKAFAHYKW